MTSGSELDYEQYMKALGARIKEARKQQGLSLRDMVVKHEYHDSQWRKFEKIGSGNLGALLRIAKVLNTSVSMLLDGLGDYPSSTLLKLKKQPSEKDDLQTAGGELGEAATQDRRSGDDRRKNPDRRTH